VLIFEGSPHLGGLAHSRAGQLHPPKVPFALGSASLRVRPAIRVTPGHGVCGTVLRVRQLIGNSPVVRRLTHRRGGRENHQVRRTEMLRKVAAMVGAITRKEA
jgi:hypothetical protein